MQFKIKDKNYRISHYHGNEYFGTYKNQGINELLINGFSVMFIPKYDHSSYSFPPNLGELIKIKESDKKFKNVDQRRYFCFYLSDLVFYESDSLDNQSFRYELDYKKSSHNLGIVHCINSELFKSLTLEMRKKMPFIKSSRELGTHIYHDNIVDLHFVKFLDKKFLQLSSLLPTDFKLSLEL